MSKGKSSDERARNFATVVYPESAPENWLDILKNYHISTFVSPLHDRDVNPGGELKKAHYHVMIMFDGNKSERQVREIFNSIGGVGLEVVKSVRGYARYLCHLDNPEKVRYNQSDVISIASDYIGTIGLSVDKYIAIAEMQDFCEDYDVSSFYALTKYAREHRSDWFRVLCDCGSLHMKEYLKSRQWSKDNHCDVIVNPATGEVL